MFYLANFRVKRKQNLISYDGEDFSVNLLGCNAVSSCGWVLTFRRKRPEDEGEDLLRMLVVILLDHAA